MKDNLAETEADLKLQLEQAMNEAAAASQVRQQLQELLEERDEWQRILEQRRKEQELISQEHSKLKIEHAKLQSEFNEWIELIEQA
jgi:hypothetical protein